MTWYIPREARHLLRSAFERCNCVFLLGPRQVGKTTLAKEFAKEYWTGWDPKFDYKCLAQEADCLQVNNIHAFITERDRKVIVLDEAQCMHELFPKLRAVLDTSTNSDSAKERWLILGSSISQLKALANRNLVGRHEKIYLTPFSLSELDYANSLSTRTSAAKYPQHLEIDTQTRKSHDTHELTLNLWLKGGFPNSFTNEGRGSLEWRFQYIHSTMGSHIPPRNNVERPDLLFPLWKRIAFEQGSCNILQLPQKLECKTDIVNNLLEFLESEKLIRKVLPWNSGYRNRLDKNPLWYIRDSGLLHSQMQIYDIDTLMRMRVMGKSWEGFVLESIMSSAPYATEVLYFRDNGLEADFVLEFNAGQRWIVEVKFNSNRGVSKGFHRACEAVMPERQFVIHGGPESFKSEKNSIDYFCLFDAMRKIKFAMKY